MHLLGRTAVGVMLILAASPAWADLYYAVTPSGTTEMLFSDSPQAVVGKLSSRCMDLKWSVVSSTGAEVVCESPLNTGESILGQMLLGNSYSTAPRRYFRFNVAEVNGISRVQAAGWMEVQMAFGQINRTDFSGPEFHNGMMNFMAGAGGKLPVGTTFPNHAFVGFDSDTIPHGKYRLPRITRVHPGSPAEKAGLRVGDVLTKVAGERIKNFDKDWLDAAARAAKNPIYEVSFVRDGANITVTVERAFRPAWNEAVAAQVEPNTPQSNPHSVADELAKLAKLRDEGTLTPDEFEAQKKKLLGD